ncbi:MAG: DUF4126 domain-containing protein [Candidatus Omnitrophica bacterium]|nr:DUF4126 domain-containing protein [Candidatus Omnitrophota bacterium]
MNLPVEYLREYGLILLIGWASGISIYLTILLVGVGGRMGWIVLPPGLEIFTHPLVIAAAFVMYAVEFCADKVPLVDSAWDSVHTFVRPAGAAALAFMAGTEYGPAIQTSLAVLTGTVALDVHAVKASSRLAINTSPEPFSNSVASVVEDSAVIMMFYFFTKHPVIATLLILVFLVGTFFVLRALWRFVLKIFRRPAAEEPRNSSADKSPVI